MLPYVEQLDIPLSRTALLFIQKLRKLNKMIQVSILEKDDIIQADDWCRPLSIVSMSGGHSDSYSFKSCYTGTPENNVEWVQVKHVIGKFWIGLTVNDYTNAVQHRMEFLRGTPPRQHQINMRDYSSLANLREPEHEDEYEDDIPF